MEPSVVVQRLRLNIQAEPFSPSSFSFKLNVTGCLGLQDEGHSSSAALTSVHNNSMEGCGTRTRTVTFLLWLQNYESLHNCIKTIIDHVGLKLLVICATVEDSVRHSLLC